RRDRTVAPSLVGVLAAWRSRLTTRPAGRRTVARRAGRRTVAYRAGRPLVAGLAALALTVLAACMSPPPATEPVVTPTPSPTEPSLEEIAAAIAASMSPEELVGQVLMPDVSLPADIGATVAEVQQYAL